MMRIGRVTASDRASAGVYADESGPAIEEAVAEIFPDAAWSCRVVPDEKDAISAAICELVDRGGCELVLTTGGTGPTARDVTPEATRAVLDKELPGFGEIQRMRTFDIAPTAILSRATAGVRRGALIINLPGRPSAVRECLAVLAPAIRKCLELLRADRAP